MFKLKFCNYLFQMYRLLYNGMHEIRPNQFTLYFVNNFVHEIKVPRTDLYSLNLVKLMALVSN